jgi:threonylcarbamoyladenosine tRNA methylthiotransferase MtaB
MARNGSILSSRNPRFAFTFLAMPEPTVITLGCRLNAYESQVIAAHARAAGLEHAVIVNTCAVTAEAVRQARQTIRRVRRDRPEARIIVTGCAAQIEPGHFAGMAEVDHVIGNASKLKPETFARLASNGFERVQIDDIMAVRATVPHMLDGFGNRVRAYVQVQNGCDHRCTFCIIPYSRGPSRSVGADMVVAQIKRLVAAGTMEVVLTGVDITAYGSDLPRAMTLGCLVRQILKETPDLARLRLSSIDQVEADNHLMQAIAEEPRLMPHLHLSMQSGDDLILKRMKRRHSRRDAIGFCAEARRLRPDIVFGADLIAGFPTETEEMFKNTLRLIDECGLTYLHVFPFSARKGTPAARMPQIDGETIKCRAARLRAMGRTTRSRYLSRQCGRECDVLVEREYRGRTPGYAEIDVGAPVAAGSIVRMRVTGHGEQRLRGIVLPSGAGP